VLASPLTRFITDAGDSGVLLPIALVGVATLWLFHSRRVALLLLRSVALACAFIAALKLLFLSCGSHWQPGLTSPSGHACLSAVVYGTLGTVVAAGRPPLVRAAIALVVIAIVGMIALSRLVLGVHTMIEVLVGLAVGTAAQLWFAWSYARMKPLRVDLKVFSLALTATVLIAFGVRLPVESVIRHMAKRLGDRCEIAVAGHVVDLPAPPRPMLAFTQTPQPSRSSASTSSASARAV
jgi:undecaprenyl-diphosphatase